MQFRFQWIQLKPATHLAILYADRSEFDHFNLLPEKRFEKSCDKIAQPDKLALLAIRSDELRKSPANGPTWRMPANLIANI